MTTPEIAKVKKRDGSIVDFEQDKISKAIFKALTVTGEGDEKLAEKLAERVIKILNRRFSKREIPDVEQIQDIVEEVLMLEELTQTAKSYIIYREQRRRMRETETIYDEAVEIYDKYINEIDWQVKENANMAYSLQGLNNYGVSTLTKRYWLNKIYPQQIREAMASGDFHIHDLDFLGAYCCGWDLYDLLKRGFGGVAGKVESKPPKHLQAALGQMVNFFYTLQGEIAGAVAFSNFDTLLAPFIRYDKLEYKQVKQAMQEFLFNCAVPTRVGFQCLSEDTEILMPNGWKKHHEIKAGETIKTFNIGKGVIEDKEVKDVFQKEYQGVMYNLKTSRQDQLISPGHRVVIKNEDGSFSTQPIEDILKINSSIFIPIILQEGKIEIDEIFPEAIKEVSYQGIIWCPNTDNETVIAKRNGQVFITGNTPFSNITVDITPSPSYAKQPVIIGGELQKETYGEFAEEMKVFNKAFFEAMLEGDKNGRVFSVDADCLCPIKNSEKIKLVKIGEYIDKLMEKRKPMFIKENNCEVLDVKDLGIKCLGLKGQKIDWQQVNFLVRHPFEHLLQVQTQGGFNIKLSPSHSVFVLKDGQICNIKALSLRKGDYLISPKTIPAGENKSSVISLVEEFVKKQKAEGIYVGAVLRKGENYKETRAVLHKRNYGKREYKYFRGVAVFPLNNIVSEIKEFNFSNAELNLAGSALKIKNTLPISSELVEFLGWYCAEGSAEKNTKYGGISLGLNLGKERRTAEHIIGLVKKIWPGLPAGLREIKARNLVEVRIHSKLLRRVITEVFELGNGNKRKVPQIIFELPNEMKKIFLNAYFQGDGWLTKDIIATSISRELIYGVSTLLKQLGVFHTLTEYQWEGRPRWRVNVFRNRDLEVKDSHTISKIPIKESGLEEVVEMILQLKPHYRDSLGRRCENTKNGVFHHFGINYFTSGSTSIKKARALLHYARELGVKISDLLQGVEGDNFSFFRVKKVEETKTSNGMVYDFSTESESFVADQLLVHNTFPIPTVNITKDFPWDDEFLEPMWLATAKYGINYFANFIQSDMKPEEVRSMCIQPDEEMIIRNSHKIKRFSIKEIVENYRKEEFDDEGWAECNKEKNLEVLSLNPSTFKTEWAKVERFFRVPVKKAIEVETEDGKKAIFSEKHPMAVLTEQGITMRWSKDIKKGDYLLSLKNAKENLSQNYQMVDNLVLNEDLACILGYFIADGNYLFENRKGYTHFGEPRGMQFTFKTGDSENLSLVKNLIKKVFNLDCKEKQDPRYNTYYLYVYNTELARKLYNAGFKKYGRLPQVLFNSPQAVIESFLEFHFKGDGYAKRQEIHINDKDLSRDLTILYSLIGKPVNYRLRENSQRIYLQHAKRKVKNGNGWLNNPIIAERAPAFLADSRKIPGFNSKKMIGFDTMEKHGAQTPESLKIKNSNIYVARVKTVQEKELEKEQTFYDVELEKNHLFVHSLGLVSFNCCRLRLNNKELLKRGGGLFGANPLTGCYDDQTEILTNQGWKFFKNLTKNDEVFTLTDKNFIELHKPNKLFEYDYNGEMYHFKTKSLDLLVTPNHRMVVDQAQSGVRKFVEAQNFNFNSHRIPKQSIWQGAEREFFVLSAVDIFKGNGPSSHFSEEEIEIIRARRTEGDVYKSIADDFNCNAATISNICAKPNYGQSLLTTYQAAPLSIKMDDWLAYFGFWLAEGSTDNENIAPSHGYRVSVCQVNEQKRKEIKEVLDRLPFYYAQDGISFVICNKQLWTYLRQFGKKYDKFIPQEIKALSKRQLKILFDWMVKGDGHVRKTTGQINYWTTSKRLADDLQEVILKLGFLGTMSVREGGVSEIKGRKVYANKCYVLGVQQARHYRLREGNIRKVFYQGKVYCCEVENHTVFVRRNGRVSWCGNSQGVVTINMSRLGYLSKTKKEFFERLERVMDLAKESLEIKRKTIEDFMRKGLYPYSRHYLEVVEKMRGNYYGNHFSTIGILGMNECLLNFMGEDIGSSEGRKFTLEVMDFMRDRMIKYQEETGNLYNLESTPAEGASYRLALKDKEKYPEIITAGTNEVPYYTNSTQLPVNYTDDVFKAVELQDEIQCKYTGGVVLHLFIGEQLRDLVAMKSLIKKIFSNYKLPYITLTPTFSICPSHGYLSGEHWQCPKCTIEQPCEVYSRIVGYIRPVQQWHKGKTQEFKERKTFQAPEAIATI